MNNTSFKDISLLSTFKFNDYNRYKYNYSINYFISDS